MAAHIIGYGSDNGPLFKGDYATAIAHGVSQGAIGWVQHKNFWQGFVSGSVSHISGVYAGKHFPGSNAYFARSAIAVTTAALLSKATGGDAMQSAMTAVIVHLFNLEGGAQKDSFHPFVPDSEFEEYFSEMDALQVQVDQLENGTYYKGISHDIGALKFQMTDLTHQLACQMDMCGINPVAPELLFVPGAGMARAGWTMKFYRYPNAGGVGLNFYKDGMRRYAIDYHKFKLNGVEKARLHYHRGTTKSQVKKHRPYQGGW